MTTKILDLAKTRCARYLFGISVLFIFTQLYLTLLNSPDFVEENGIKKTIKSTAISNAQFICQLVERKLISRDPTKVEWMRLRSKGMCAEWFNTAKELGLRSSRKYNVLLVIGLLIDEDKYNFGRNAFSGGPLGELVQWTDTYMAYSFLYHNVELIVDYHKLNEVFRQDRNLAYYDVIVSDYIGLEIMKKINSKVGRDEKIKCKFRIVDSFGTEAEFNSGFKETPWGTLRIYLKQYYTLYPHSPDNSFLGFVIPNYVEKTYKKADNIAIVYAKEMKFLNSENVRQYLNIISEDFTIHTTFTGNYDSKFINHGVMKKLEYFALLEKAKIFIGVGFPFDGPAPLEAISKGCIFFNPQLEFPINRENSKFWSSKPTFRYVKSQNDYCEQYIGLPNVHTFKISDFTYLRQILPKIKAQEEFKGYLPFEFTPAGMLSRIQNYLDNERFCDTSDNISDYHLKKLIAISGNKGESCGDTCKRNKLICEPNLFKAIHLKNDDENECRQIDESLKFTIPSIITYKEKNITCISNQKLYYSCTSYHNDSFRICPCREYVKGNVSLL